MPARAGKRKPKRRKSSSRKKARRRRRVVRSRVNPPSSDEDFVLDGDGDESNSGSSDQEDNEDDTDSDEEEAGESEDSENEEGGESEKSENEEENFRNEVRSSDANIGLASRRRRQSTRARNGLVNATIPSDGPVEHVNRTRRVRRRHRRQDSSDEDFDVDLERILEHSLAGNEGRITSRPTTRAMDFRQVSDVGDTEQGNDVSDSLEHETRSLPDSLRSGTSLQTRNPLEGDTESVRKGSRAIHDHKIGTSKGKEKVSEAEESTARIVAEETTAVVCGICWTEMGVVERGKLDSCNHFFCFGCIMEWAKVESRCPMCKQRFTTIARSGTDISKRPRVIRIPTRNQVYIPPDDPELPPEDPYADIVCMECQGTGDEGLLLLCDRCDSAAHTFCVGLGRSVPRGDWYCRECQSLTGGMSSSEAEAEELILDDDDDEGDDYDDESEERQSLLRSIVASDIPESRHSRQVADSRHSRQARARGRLASASSSAPLQRSRRGRLWRRLPRRQRGRHIAAPRLSQAARALLSSTSSEPNNQASRAPHVLQNGSARTVPQQRRLQERINDMRNNWGRIQNGDLHFDALGSGETRPMLTAVLSNSNGAASRAGARELTQVVPVPNPNIAPIAPVTPIIRPVSEGDRNVESFVQPDFSVKGIKDVERAWRMMGHAQNLGSGSSKSHQQKLGTSSVSSVLGQVRLPTDITASSPISSLMFGRNNFEIPTSPPLRKSSTGSYKPENMPNVKHDEIPYQRAPTPIAPSFALAGECRKEKLPSSSNCKQTSGWETTENLASTQGFKPELPHTEKALERKDAGVRDPGLGITRTAGNRDVSAAREDAAAGSLSSHPHEGLKVHLTELVKKQTWPVYITERLDKEQFKRIARAAVHSLLALCHPNNKSVSLSCGHFEDQGIDPVVKCCIKCLDQHVEKAVKNAKDKIIPT